MKDIGFINAAWVHLLWLALVLSAALLWFERRSVQTLHRFVSHTMQRRLANMPRADAWSIRVLFFFLMFVSATVALMRPQAKGVNEAVASVQRRSDIMVVLDVSKSMLAEDAAPNRLGRAKAEISEMLSTLAGHRVGLVSFAGRAVVSCPLTPDYGFFRMILRSAGPTTVGRGGTRIGDALRTAVRAFSPGVGAKLILLITDGEDHDSYPKEAADLAKKEGIRVVAVGFGSEGGSPITLTDPKTGAKTQLTDKNGQVVQSRLDGELLRELALVTEGAYIPAGVSALDLESIVADHIQPLIRTSAQKTLRIVALELYPWFVLAAMAFLIAAVSVRKRKETLL